MTDRLETPAAEGMAGAGQTPDENKLSDPRKPRYLVGLEGVAGQGPFMLLVLTAQADRILEARFQTYGCPAAQACGQYAATWAQGKTLAEAGGLTEEGVLQALGGMPLGREHCPGLAVRAMRDALKKDAAPA